MEALGSARLTEEIPAQRAVATLISREEIRDALGDDGERPELLLQIDRQGDDGTERSTIGMTWSREDLEQLLERATGDRIVLTFDREELAETIVDVEAHGLQERALVFAVAATGALGAGALANAMPAGLEGGGAAQSSSAPYVTDVSSAGGYTAPAATTSDTMLTDASSGSGYTTPAETTASDAMLTDASSSGGFGPAAEPAPSGGGLDIQAPSATDGLLAGAVALAIAGAAFATRRRPGAARPA